MKKNNKGFSLVELIVVVLIMAIIATALTLAVTKYVAKSKRSSDANTAGELKTAAETAITDYLTSVDALDEQTITITGATGAGDPGAWTISSDKNTFKTSDFSTIFTTAAGSTAPKSKVHPTDSFKVTITVFANESASYAVAYVTDTATDIFKAATK